MRRVSAFGAMAVDDIGADMGSTSPGGSSADFAKFIADETERWAKVVKYAGIKAD